MEEDDPEEYASQRSGLHFEDDEGSEDGPPRRHSKHSAKSRESQDAEMEQMMAKGSEARRTSRTASDMGLRIAARKSHAQSPEFLKDLRMITEWGAVLTTRGREVVQLQAAQVGGICKLIGALHSELNTVSKNVKESVQELVDASNAASEHREAIERALRDDRDRVRSLDERVSMMHEEIGGQLSTLADDSKESRKDILETLKKSENDTQQTLQEQFSWKFCQVDEAGQKNEEAIGGLYQQLDELDRKLLGNFNRLRDEHNRVDNLADHALRAVNTLDEVQRRLDWAEGAEQDVKTVARTVGGLQQELRQLKGLDLDLGSYDEENEEEYSSEEAMSQVASLKSPSPKFSPFRATPLHETIEEQEDPTPLSSPSGQAVASPNGSPSADSVSPVAAPVPRSRAASMAYMAHRPSRFLANQIPAQLLAALGGSSDDESGSVFGKLEQRLAKLEQGEKEMLQAYENLERRVSSNQTSRGAVDTMKKEFATLKDSSTEFQDYVVEQLQIFRKTELEHAIQNFRSRWTTVVTLISPLELFKCWARFVEHRMRTREALVKVKSIYAKRHVGSRVQSWNYISQKCLAQATSDKIERREESVETQLETLAATVRKRERAAVEQAKDVHSRISMVEKKLENHASKKADHIAMVEMVGALAERIEREVQPGKIKENMTDLWAAVKALEANKTDVKMTERNGKRVNELTMEVRQAVKNHGEAIKKCATHEDLAKKANASIVEQVVVLLSQQADQLARLVASDLNMFKLTLGRFLELSPDVRKAALSLGLQENEQCMTCRRMDKKMFAEPLTGTDGNLYRMSPESLEAMSEETQRVVNEKIKFPPQLMSSLAAGATSSPFGDSWAPVRQQSPMDTTTRLPAKASGKIFDPELVDKTEHQALLSRIRTLVHKEPGWLSGPDLRSMAGADVSRRKGKAARKTPSPERPSSRPPSVAAVAAVPTFATVTGPAASPPTPIHSAPPLAAGRGRPPSSRSYFPASAASERGEVKRSLFKDLPPDRLKSSSAVPAHEVQNASVPGESQVPSSPESGRGGDA